MNLKTRIESFSRLGEILRNSISGNGGDPAIEKIIEKQEHLNPWFTSENVRMAIAAIANELTEENLTKWTAAYPLLHKDTKPLNVAVIMAGNIPLVGFHDFLCVLISGNNIIAKTSSKDQDLIVYISNLLCSINPQFRNMIRFTEGILSDFNAVIATGSDNSSRYFEYYFGKYPNIIRKNRNSISIIEGDESDEELESLGIDVFSYFGLGCRNVSKLYIPSQYDLKKITDKWSHYSYLARHSKYSNNYDFNKAVYLVNRESFLDTGYLLLKEDSRISSPVSVLYYEYYESIDAVKQLSDLLKEKIQCITGRNYIPFGKAQCPHLWDYADGIDVLDFLLKKNIAGIL